MKKNISRIAALLAAAALVFGAVGCSSDDDEDNTPGSAPVAVTGVTVDKSSVSLTVGDTATVTATVTPSNATDNTVTWDSSDTSIATVDSNGKITAVAAGSATVTVTTTDGKKTAEVAVTVTAKGSGGEGGGTEEKTVTVITVTNGTSDKGTTYKLSELEAAASKLPEGAKVYSDSACTTEITDISSVRAGDTIYVVVTTSGDTPDTPSTSATGKAKYLYLNITANSSSEPSYAATYEGDTLGAKVSDVVTYLTNGTGFVSSVATMSQKLKGDLPENYAVTGKNSKNNSMSIGDSTFYYYGKTVFTVTASADKAATVTGISGYFGSGKSVLQVYYSTDGGKTFTALTNDSTVDVKKGVYVKDSALNIAVAAGGTQTIELYLGKIADKAPSDGATVELSQIDLTIVE